MTAPMLRMPAAPRFDPQRDGNPFAWIIEQAERVKAQRKAAALEHRLRHQYPILRPREEA